MASKNQIIREHLANSFQELLEEELKKFKSKLTYVELKRKIPRSQIKKAENSEDLAETLINFYGSNNALKVTIKVLKKIHQRSVAEMLRHEVKEKECKNKKEDDDTDEESSDDSDDDDTDEESSEDDDDDTDEDSSDDDDN